jgi:sugar O-acyltransferase (sialic acid O-acetyltransferase NeuD family)
MITDVVIIGSGGLGREIVASMNKNHQNNYNILGYVDDYCPANTIVNDHVILGSIDWLINSRPCENVIIGFSNIIERIKLINRLSVEAFVFPTIIHPTAYLLDSSNIRLGNGVIVLPFSVITTNVNIGNHVLLHIGTKIHHDTQIGNNCIIMPNVSITGGAKIGNNVYIGTGSILPTAININDEANIPAGSILTHDIS